MSEGYEGGCHCGAVRYQIKGRPTSSMICHCRTCRAISGAPVVAWVSAPADSFAIVAGRPKHYASSPPVNRQFCGECGTQLTYATSAHADSIDVATASLDGPDAFPPTHHSWLEHDLAWLTFGDGLPTYRRSRGSAEIST